jgi:hypothetical protein
MDTNDKIFIYNTYKWRNIPLTYKKNDSHHIDAQVYNTSTHHTYQRKRDITHAHKYCMLKQINAVKLK